MVRKSKEQLFKDLEMTGVYVQDHTQQLELLQKERDLKKREIRKLTAKINFLKKQNEEYQKNKKLSDHLMVLKGVIETKIRQILNERDLSRDIVDLEKLDEDIYIIKEKIAGYDIETKLSAANVFIHEKMKSICSKLDFEEELKPANLHFDLKTFNFYHSKENQRIYLSEMGSGANWLACHLSLFLSLLHLIVKEKNSCIPSILFLDQPSQVYFPNTVKLIDPKVKTNEHENDSYEDDTIDENKNSHDENIKQVENIFNVIIEELDTIAKDYNYSPQIIVLEHADGLTPTSMTTYEKDGSNLEKN